MARRTPTFGTRKPPESFTATLRLRGQDYVFRLFVRPLRLGDYGTVDYYWMDSSQFRDIESQASAENFRNCIGYWAAAMRDCGLGNDLEQQIHYVTAICYGLVCRCKGMQDVYRDAYLAPGKNDLGALSLPDPIRRRIHRITQAQDRFKVQKELDRTLGRFAPPARVLPALREAFRHWVGNGVVRMRQNGNDGLVEFMAEVDSWLARYRKKGGQVWVRHFINLFAYEAKVSFFRCYANVWIGLIPWLKKHRGLDELSERFLRMWHNQNQPVEVPHGCTAGGVYYPTDGRATVLAKKREGLPDRRSISWKTEHLGPTHFRDVFNGQTLSLHPLSGFFMKDAALCAIAGRCFASENYQQLIQGRTVICPEYWDLIGAVLSAAHLYRLAWERQRMERGVQPLKFGEIVETATAQGNDYTHATLLEEYAGFRKIRCPNCKKALRFRHYRPQKKDGTVPVDYSCTVCKKVVHCHFEGQALIHWLSPRQGKKPLTSH